MYRYTRMVYIIPYIYGAYHTCMYGSYVPYEYGQYKICIWYRTSISCTIHQHLFSDFSPFRTPVKEEGRYNEG